MPTATETTAAMTMPTKEEAAAIQAWSEALRAAEEALNSARPDGVRFEVLEHLGIDWLEASSVVARVRLARRAAEEAKKKNVSSVSDEAR